MPPCSAPSALRQRPDARPEVGVDLDRGGGLAVAAGQAGAGLLEAGGQVGDGSGDAVSGEMAGVDGQEELADMRRAALRAGESAGLDAQPRAGERRGDGGLAIT